MSQHQPANYSTVSPYLIVTGADETIEFLKKVFGAVELRRFPGESGKVMHAEVRIDDTVIMLADGAPPDWPPLPSACTSTSGTWMQRIGGCSMQEPHRCRRR